MLQKNVFIGLREYKGSRQLGFTLGIWDLGFREVRASHKRKNKDLGMTKLAGVCCQESVKAP